MENQTYKYLYKDALTALKSNQLFLALQSLQGMAATTKSWNVKEEIDNIVDSYQILLSYFAKGINDPDRTKLYKQYITRAYELAEILLREGNLKDETTFYTSTFNTLKKMKGEHFLLSELLTPSTSVRDMFDAVWTSGAWNNDDTNAIYNYLSNSDISEEAKCVLLSATTLSTMQYYDIAKVKLLLDQTLSDNIRLRVRALTGIVLATSCFPERLKLYNQAFTQLKLTSESESFAEELSTLQLQLFISLETKQIERKFEEKIIPEMMKHMETFRVNSSLGFDNQNDRLTDEDLNPAWNEQAITPEMEKFFKDYANLQSSGADVYMTSFKMLKNRFPFFNAASNWLYPFTFSNPDLPTNCQTNKVLTTLLGNINLCDSDKYSMCLMLGQEKIAAQLFSNSKITDFLTKNPPSSALPKEEKETFEQEVRSYIQSLYRFSNLYTHREAFVNPFQQNMFLFDYEEFSATFNNKVDILNMANKLFKIRVYDIAQKLFAIVAKEHQSSDIYQKLGYCYEHFNDTENAYNNYSKANILAPDTAWTLQRLATCCVKTERYEEALTCYTQLSNKRADDVSIALHQAECLIHLKRYEEAFKYLFKVNYLDPTSHNSERALAWCSLLTQKYEQAEKYYLKVLSAHPTPTDYLNAGHSAWLLGNYNEAIGRYKKCLPKEEPNNFLKADIAILKKAGLGDEEISLMTDAVLSNI